MTPQDKRKNTPASDKELYKSDIDDFIKTERRRDELDRLNEIKEQNTVWLFTTRLCIAINAVFLILAIYGWITNGFI